VEVRVPDIGDFKDVAVIEVFVKPGDTVKLEQSLITVESDKASMEIPSSPPAWCKRAEGQARRHRQHRRSAGHSGRHRGRCAPAVAATAPAPPPQRPRQRLHRPRRPLLPCPPTNPTGAPVGLPHASPSVRKFARELGVPLAEVKGSGPQGPHHRRTTCRPSPGR
jgi:pyruvate dehydrogenase E2 component (dihydrolipoamide acetyltransferase)